MNGGREVAPTRSNLQALQDEQELAREGYEHLDQKRALLAAELKRWRERYEALRREVDTTLERATLALAESVARHGLEAVTVHPCADRSPGRVELETRRLMGADIVEARLDREAAEEGPDPASPELRRCRSRFRELLAPTVELAAVAANVRRLEAEYRRTERRTRAIENVLLPELDEAIRGVRSALEAVEQEELVRSKLARERRGNG